MITQASKNTNFLKADSKLTMICSALINLAVSEQQSYDDMRMWHAPSECWDLIQRQIDDKKKALFESYDMDETEFVKEMQLRTSERWVYYFYPF